MEQYHGLAYQSLVPIDPTAAVKKIWVDIEPENNPDGMEHRRPVYGIRKLLCNQMSAVFQSTYLFQGINGAAEVRAVQVVLADIDATGTITIQYSVNGRDWVNLATPITQSVTSAAGRQSFLWSFSDMACLQFRLGWSPGGGATTGTIEVYVI